MICLRCLDDGWDVGMRWWDGGERMGREKRGEEDYKYVYGNVGGMERAEVFLDMGKSE